MTSTPQINKRLEVTEIWLYKKMLRIPWVEYVNNKEVLKETKKKGNLFTIRKMSDEISRVHNERD